MSELQSEVLSMFLPSPNQLHGEGEFRDFFVVNHDASSHLDREMYRCFGQLIGIAIRR